MTHKTVWISNRSRDHTYDAAREFGSPKYITQGNYPIFKTARLREEIIDALVYSEPDDYLLLSGSSVIAGLCMAVWLALHGKATLLLYDRKVGEYVERSLDGNGLRVEIEKARDKAADA